MLLLLLATACNPSDCASLPVAGWRDSCLSEKAVETFSADRQGAITMAESISDPVTRDYTWYVLTRDKNPMSGELCQRIQDPNMKERCEVFPKRPHLLRDQGGPGAPPPGAPPGGGPPQGR